MEKIPRSTSIQEDPDWGFINPGKFHQNLPTPSAPETPTSSKRKKKLKKKPMRNFSNSVAIKAKMGKRTGNLPSGSSTFEELHQKPGISAQETPRSPERKETQMGFS